MTALDLRAIEQRAEHAYTWIGEDPNGDDFLPLSVREHFNTDVPALVREIQHLWREADSAGRQLQALAEREQGARRNALESLAAALLSVVVAA